MGLHGTIDSILDLYWDDPRFASRRSHLCDLRFPKRLVFLAQKEKKNTRKLVTLNKWTLWHTPYEECHTSKLSIVPILLDIPDDDEVLPKHVEYLQAVLNNYGYV